MRCHKLKFWILGVLSVCMLLGNTPFLWPVYSAEEEQFPVGEHGGQVIDIDPPEPPPNTSPTGEAGQGQAGEGHRQRRDNAAADVQGTVQGQQRTPPPIGTPPGPRPTGPQPGLPDDVRDVFGPLSEVPDTPVNPGSEQNPTNQRTPQGTPRPPLDDRLNPNIAGRNVGRPQAPAAEDIDELMKKLADPEISEIDKKRITAVIFYNQDIYRDAVLDGKDGKFKADDDHVKLFLKYKREMQLEVIQRMGMKYKNKYGRAPKVPIIPFSYTNILSDDDIITGTGKVGRNLEPLYVEALNEIVQERAARPMTDADRRRVDVNGLAWNMTQDGALADIAHKEKYINPQSGHANKAKLIEDIKKGKLNAMVFDDFGRLVELDINESIKAVDRLQVDAGLKIPGIDVKVGSGAMSDFLRSAQDHSVSKLGANMTRRDVGSFIRNQKYTARNTNQYDAVFQADNKLSREFKDFLDLSAEIRDLTTVEDVAKALQNGYGIEIIGRGGDLDFNKLVQAITIHEQKQLTTVMPKMIAEVTKTEAYKIIQYVKTADAVTRRELRKQLALTYGPMSQKSLDTIVDQIEHMSVDPADKKFLLKVLQEDTKQIKQYAKVMGRTPSELTEKMVLKGNNMAVVDLIETKDVKVKSLSKAMDAVKGGSRYKKFLKTRTAMALNLDTMLDTSRENRGSFLMQWGIIYVAASRAYSGASTNEEGLKKVGRIMFEMIPFMAMSLRYSEGDMREASKEFMMDVMPPVALASLAVSFFDYAIKEGIVNPFTESMLDQVAAETARDLGDSAFEETDIEGLYRLKNKDQVFEYLDEISPGMGGMGKLANFSSLVAPQVDAIVSRNKEFQINNEALAACQWFEKFNEDSLEKKYKKNMTLTQLKAKVYEQGIPSAASASPVERVAARIILDNVRIRKEAYEQVLYDFVWRIEKVYNEQKESEDFDPKEIITQAMDKINEMYDNLPEGITQSDWATEKIDEDYNDRMGKLIGYDGGGQEEYDLKAEMQEYIDGFRNKIEMTLAGLDMFREQRYLDLKMQVFGGYRSMIPLNEHFEANLVQGDVFRVGISANVSPKRKKQKWTVYYYTVHRKAWQVFAQKEISKNSFNPGNEDGNWVMTAPEEETFATIEVKTLEEFFINPRGYNRILAVLAFGDWPSDPLTHVGIEALRAPIEYGTAFEGDLAAFTSPAIELYTSRAAFSIEMPAYFHEGQEPFLIVRPTVDTYYREEKATAKVAFSGPQGSWAVDVGFDVKDVSMDKDNPTTIPLELGLDARDGTFEVNVSLDIPHVLEDYQPNAQTKMFTYVMKTDEPPVDDQASTVSDEPEVQTAELFAALQKIMDLHTGAEGLVAHAQSLETEIRDEINTVTSGLQDKVDRLTALESEVNALNKRVTDINKTLRAAQGKAEAAQQAAELAAGARSDVQTNALNCCTLAEQAKQSDERSRINELASQARLADDQVRTSKTTYETKLSQAKTELNNINKDKLGLEYFKGDTAKFKIKLQQEQSSTGMVAADMDLLKIMTEEILLDKNALLNVLAEADLILEEAKKVNENTDLSPEDKSSFKQIKAYHGQITNLKKTAEDMYTSAQSLIAQPAQKVSDYDTKMKNIKASFDTIANTMVDPKTLSELTKVSANAQSWYDAAEVFEDSVNDSAQKSAVCLRAAEDHLANLPDTVSPDIYCDTNIPGSIFMGRYRSDGKPSCECPDNIGKWDNPVNPTRCVWEDPPTQTAKQICNDSFLGSIPTGGYDANGRPYCKCPSNMQWNDPNNKILCVKKTQVVQPSGGPRDSNRQQDTMRCGLIIQNIKIAQQYNDKRNYDSNMQLARNLNCQVPGGVAGWTPSPGDTGSGSGGVSDWLSGTGVDPRTGRETGTPGTGGTSGTTGTTGGTGGGWTGSTGTTGGTSGSRGTGTRSGSGSSGSGDGGCPVSVLGQCDYGDGGSISSDPRDVGQGGSMPTPELPPPRR